MADLGNIAALKAAIQAILNNSVPDLSIEPDDHNGLLEDLLDTITGLDKVLRVNAETGGYDLTITAGDLIKLADSGFFGDIDTATLTADRTYTFQDASGVVAFLTDIPAALTDTDDLPQGAVNLYNQTHTGEVTGSVALTVDPTAISNKANKVTLAGTEKFLIEDGGILKHVLASDLGGGATEVGTGTDSLQQVGVGANASGNDSISLGTSSLASTSSVAIGQLTQANSTASTALGVQSSVSSDFGVAVGYANSVTGLQGIAIGRQNTAVLDAIAMGNTVNASGSYSISIGNGGTTASNVASIAIGRACSSSGLFSIAIGVSGVASATNSMMFAASNSTRTNATASSVEFNFDEATSTIRLAKAADSWINTANNFGIGLTSPTAKLHTAASTTSAASFRVEPSTVANAPTTPNNGDLVYMSDTDATFTSVGFWGYENGTWIKL